MRSEFRATIEARVQRGTLGPFAMLALIHPCVGGGGVLTNLLKIEGCHGHRLYESYAVPQADRSYTYPIDMKN